MAAFPGTQFYVVTQRPGMFLADIDQNGNIIECPGIKYIVADNEDARTFILPGCSPGSLARQGRPDAAASRVAAKPVPVGGTGPVQHPARGDWQ